jgi:hypothetical protein
VLLHVKPAGNSLHEIVIGCIKLGLLHWKAREEGQQRCAHYKTCREHIWLHKGRASSIETQNKCHETH